MKIRPFPGVDGCSETPDTFYSGRIGHFGSKTNVHVLRSSAKTIYVNINHSEDFKKPF
jgi:hypothetical protein